MPATRKRASRPSDPTQTEVLWGGPKGPGLVHVSQLHSQQLGEMIEAQKNTQNTVAALAAQTAEMRREAIVTEKRLASLERIKNWALVMLASVGAFALLLGEGPTIIAHAQAMGLHLP